MLHRLISRRFTLLPLALLALSCGCQFGPSSLRVSHSEYNEAIQQSAAEQLLLNLVRLKYREAPMVLDVGSISAQFEISQGFGVAGTLNENVGQVVNGASREINTGLNTLGATTTFNKNRIHGHNPDQLGLNGQFGYSERPTVTYTPLQGQDFAERMLTPISLPTLIKLANSGWRIDRVLNLTVEGMNGLDNVSAASGPTPSVAPEFEDFLKAIQLMRDLQTTRSITLEYEAIPLELSSPVPLDAVSPSVVLQAATAHARFRPTDDGKQAVLTQDVDHPVMQIRQTADNAALVADFRRMLQLDPAQDRYQLVQARTVAASGAKGPNGYTKLVLDTRSLMGVMFLLSQSVEIPWAHTQAGLVTSTVDASGRPFDWSRAVGHLLRVQESALPPLTSALSIRKGGYYFYIPDNDLNSKSTFLLLGQLFSLRAGTATGSSPLLTLPLGG